MIRWKSQLVGGAAVAVVTLAGFALNPANGAVSGVGQVKNAATGVDSCTLKNPHPKLPLRNAANLPLGKRLQTYRPDNYDCEGAKFAKPGVEFRRFPQPHDFHITNRKVLRLARVCQTGTCSTQLQTVWEPTRSVNPLAPYFPPFTHFVLLLRENHTFDDTQNGNNGPDHISNTYRVPTVVVASPLYMKQGYITHVAYSASNVLAVMERVMENVHPGIIDPNNNLGLSTFPMTTADQAALGDPLEALWSQGSVPLTATAAGTPTTGNAPLNVSFTGSGSGGTAPYSYSWNFGDGSATSTAQNPSHTYSSAGTYTATLTVTDSASPANSATSTVTVKVSAVGSPLTATASALPTSGQVPLNSSFTGSASGGTPPYSYSWNFGDGSATSTAQNPTHTYNNAGTYTATLTVTDSSSPAKTASSTVTITATPIAGTPPGPPTGLTGSPGNGQVSLSWTPPANNGGVAISSYRVYRGTASGGETLVTTGGCSGLGAVTSCTDTGLTNGQQYFYEVSAVNSLGEGNKSSEATATPTSGTCPPAQLLGNNGFETGTAAPWSASSGVISDNTQEPPHSGSWDAWLDGYGTTHTDTLSQPVTLPAGCSNYNLSFWLHIDTAETSTTTAYDTLKVQVLNSSGTVLATLHTYSNLNHNTGYAQHSFSLAPYAGQTIKLKFTGAEDYELQTSFVLDDTAINVS